MQTAEIIKFQAEKVRMADLDDGYTRIANELLEAFYSSNFTERQFKIVMFVMRKTYGFNKKLDYITNTQIADAIGVHHTHVCKSKIDLIDRNILILDGKKIGINKNLSDWVLAKSTNISQISKGLVKSANTTLAKSTNAYYPNQLNTKDNITKEKKDNKKTMTSTDKVGNPKKISIDFNGVMQAYREVALKDLSLPEELNAKRKKAIEKIAKLLIKPDVDTFKNYFERFMTLITNKPFYRGGQSGNEWKATFDYVLREDTLIKTREGAL